MAQGTLSLSPVEGGDKFLEATLPLDEPVILGRYLFLDDSCNTPFKAVSRRHAEVWGDGDKLWIRDLHSSNGTYVNTRNISHMSSPCPLVSGDVIQLGRIVDARDGTYYRKIVARVKHEIDSTRDSDVLSESWDTETVRCMPRVGGFYNLASALPSHQGLGIAPTSASRKGPAVIRDWRQSFAESLETLDSTAVLDESVWISPTRLQKKPRAVGLSIGHTSEIYSGALILAIGSSFSTVKVAIKCIRLIYRPLDKVIKGLVREVHVWQKLKHPNILPFYGLLETVLENELPAMISPWCEQGHIMNYLANIGDHPEIVLIKIALLQNVLNGLDYLHKEDKKSGKLRIVHGDLKGENILISDGGQAQLCDFGLSNIVRSAENSSGSSCVKGTLRFMAPELFETDDAYATTQSDIWAYGCVVLQVVSGKMPYYTKKDNQVVKALGSAELPERPPNVPDDYWDIALECLKIVPSERPSTPMLEPKWNGLGLREVVGVPGSKLIGSTLRSEFL